MPTDPVQLVVRGIPARQANVIASQIDNAAPNVNELIAAGVPVPLANELAAQIVAGAASPPLRATERLMALGFAATQAACIAGAISEGATGILRAVSPFNRFPNQLSTFNIANTIRYAGRQSHYIGSGDCMSLKLLLNNVVIDTFATTNINPGNDCTYINVFLEHVALGITVRVTFNGSNSITLTNGQYDVTSDDILPSAFGLTKFDRGTLFRVRTECEIPANGKLVQTRFIDDSNCGGFYFNPASASVNNIGGTGALSFTGSTTSIRGPAPMLLGKFISGDPRTWAGIGDSIFDGAGDQLAPAAGVGTAYFARAAYGSSPATALGGINFGMSSGKIGMWHGGGGTTPREQYFSHIKYVNSVVDEYGTNEFDNTANANTSGMNAIWNLQPAFWNYLRSYALANPRAAPFYIIKAKLLPRTQTPTGNTPADQVVFGPRWDVGGNAADFNNRIDAALGLAQINAVFETKTISRADPSSDANADYHKWIQGLLSTADGTHPTSAVHTSLASGLRTLMNAA